MRTATLSVWPFVVAFTYVFAHGYAQQSVMQKLRKREQWAVLLRKQIKDAVGQGFNICGHFRTEGVHSGVTKLTFRNEVGQRGSVMLPFECDHTSNKFDSTIWHMCGKQPSLYGLNESEPQVTFEERIKLQDKFTEYFES